MQEMAFSTMVEQRPKSQRPRRGLAVMLSVLVLMGLGGGGWYSWHSGWLHSATPILGPNQSSGAVATSSAGPGTGAGTGSANAAIVAQGNLIQGNMIATNAALADATARLTALQQRLAELDQQALSASGQATRAEALLVAFATRRAIERGQPLGYLEGALRVRFGDSQPTAVDQIVGAAQKPVTIDNLTAEFIRIEPRLANGPANESVWDWMSRQFSSLFIIRHDDMPSPAPASRIERARVALAGQQVELAISEIERLPGKDAATDWLAHARGWVNTQHALDQIESTALAIPLSAPVVPPIAAPAPSPVPVAGVAPDTAPASATTANP